VSFILTKQDKNNFMNNEGKIRTTPVPFVDTAISQIGFWVSNFGPNWLYSIAYRKFNAELAQFGDDPAQYIENFIKLLEKIKDSNWRSEARVDALLRKMNTVKHFVENGLHGEIGQSIPVWLAVQFKDLIFFPQRGTLNLDGELRSSEEITKIIEGRKYLIEKFVTDRDEKVENDEVLKKKVTREIAVLIFLQFFPEFTRNSPKKTLFKIEQLWKMSNRVAYILMNENGEILDSEEVKEIRQIQKELRFD
jgi:hypothetical protein